MYKNKQMNFPQLKLTFYETIYQQIKIKNKFQRK